MATVIKKNGKYCVVYRYVDEFGKTKQKWETFSKKKDAELRKSQIDVEQANMTFIVPKTLTIKEFTEEFIVMYGTQKWCATTYERNLSLLNNYVFPYIGDIHIQKFNTMSASRYVLKLTKLPAKNGKGYVTKSTIRDIVKILRTIFKQAFVMEIIYKNPFDHVEMPKYRYKKRDIWDAKTIQKALDLCDDPVLFIAINLSFSCSLRMGEICGLTWDCVEISKEHILKNDAYLIVEKQLMVVDKHCAEKTDSERYIKFFDSDNNEAKHVKVLSKPKTESSIRKIWIPKTVAYMLIEYKKEQDKLKKIFGSEYCDNNFVCCLNDGKPMVGAVMLSRFHKLIKENDLPHVCFHSLRHSSTTYKLKLNHGDLKATQGDTGHAEIDMITDIYAHILDEDRKVNAQKFDDAFYTKKKETQTKKESNEELVNRLKKNPELLKQFAEFIKMGQK